MAATQPHGRDPEDRVDGVRRTVLGVVGAGLLFPARARGASAGELRARGGSGRTEQAAANPVTRALDALEETERSLRQAVSAVEGVLDDLDAESAALSGATSRMLDAVDRLERTVGEVDDAARRDARTRADAREVAREGIEGARARLDYALALVEGPGPDVAGQLGAVDDRLSAVEEEFEDAFDQLGDAAAWTDDRRQERAFDSAARSVERGLRALDDVARAVEDGDPERALRTLDGLREAVAGHVADLRGTVTTPTEGKRRERPNRPFPDTSPP